MVWLVKPDHVTGEDKLVFLRAVIVGGDEIRALEADFRTENNARADPVIPRKTVFGVFGRVAGALAPDIVEILISDREGVLLAELPFNVVEDGPLRRVAALPTRGAPRAVGAVFDGKRPENARH